MRTLAIAALIESTALATPAAARDGSDYVGVDAGVIKPTSLKLDFANPTTSVNDGLRLKHKFGLDADLVVGYDFGMFRLELEAGYKRSRLKSARIDPAAAIADGSAAIAGTVDANGRATVGSGMLNALFDFGGNDGFGGSVGLGAGYARVRYSAGLSPSSVFNFRDEDSGFA